MSAEDFLVTGVRCGLWLRERLTLSPLILFRAVSAARPIHHVTALGPLAYTW